MVGSIGEVAAFILQLLKYASSSANFFTVPKDATLTLVFELGEACNRSKDLRTAWRLSTERGLLWREILHEMTSFESVKRSVTLFR
jgi:hypothetical protein